MAAHTPRAASAHDPSMLAAKRTSPSIRLASRETLDEGGRVGHFGAGLASVCPAEGVDGARSSPCFWIRSNTRKHRTSFPVRAPSFGSGGQPRQMVIVLRATSWPTEPPVVHWRVADVQKACPVRYSHHRSHRNRERNESGRSRRRDGGCPDAVRLLMCAFSKEPWNPRVCDGAVGLERLRQGLGIEQLHKRALVLAVEISDSRRPHPGSCMGIGHQKIGSLIESAGSRSASERLNIDRESGRSSPGRAC